MENCLDRSNLAILEGFCEVGAGDIGYLFEVCDGASNLDDFEVTPGAEVEFLGGGKQKGCS